MGSSDATTGEPLASIRPRPDELVDHLRHVQGTQFLRICRAHSRGVETLLRHRRAEPVFEAPEEQEASLCCAGGGWACEQHLDKGDYLGQHDSGADVGSQKLAYIFQTVQRQLTRGCVLRSQSESLCAS